MNCHYVPVCSRGIQKEVDPEGFGIGWGRVGLYLDQGVFINIRMLSWELEFHVWQGH